MFAIVVSLDKRYKSRPRVEKNERRRRKSDDERRRGIARHRDTEQREGRVERTEGACHRSDPGREGGLRRGRDREVARKSTVDRKISRGGSGREEHVDANFKGRWKGRLPRVNRRTSGRSSASAQTLTPLIFSIEHALL